MGTINGQVPSTGLPSDYMENGRMYHGFRKGMYMYPCDEPEKNRMDIFHQLFLVARRDELHRARIQEHADDVRILDLGTGTGIWAIDMADKYSNAEVVGLDLANIQPEKIPPNLRFRVPRDYESPSWSLGEDSWDLIHIRLACGSVQSWPELYQKVFLHLKPGFGYIEQVEIDMQPRCDDGTLPHSPIVQWYDYLKDATRRASRPIEYQQNTRRMLESAGFTDIEEQVIKAPFNTWPRDSHQKTVGRWYCVGLLEGLEALSMAPFTRVYGWAPEDVKRLTSDVKTHVMKKKIHAYNNIKTPAKLSYMANNDGLVSSEFCKTFYVGIEVSIIDIGLCRRMRGLSQDCSDDGAAVEVAQDENCALLLQHMRPPIVASNEVTASADHFHRADQIPRNSTAPTHSRWSKG